MILHQIRKSVIHEIYSPRGYLINGISFT